MRRILELVDGTWPWLPLGLAGLAAAVAVISLATASGPSERERVGNVVRDFGTAAADGNGAGVCSLLTPKTREDVAARIRGMDCADYARSFGIGTPGRQLRDAPRSEPVVRGTTAAVELPTIGVRVELLDVDGDWRVERLVPIPARAAG